MCAVSAGQVRLLARFRRYQLRSDSGRSQAVRRERDAPVSRQQKTQRFEN